MKTLIVLFAIATSFPERAIAQSVRTENAPAIQVKPDKALVDEVVSISVAGLAPKQVASVSATMTDNHGTVWRSSAEFIADQKGALDLRKQALW